MKINLLDTSSLISGDLHFTKTKVCNCEQCKAAKNKRKNRKLKKKIKRSLNKLNRKTGNNLHMHYWA